MVKQILEYIDIFTKKRGNAIALRIVFISIFSITIKDRKKCKQNGKDVPLKPIEMKILALIKCMNNIKRLLTTTDGIDLINDLIKDTQVQTN